MESAYQDIAVFPAGTVPQELGILSQDMTKNKVFYVPEPNHQLNTGLVNVEKCKVSV